MWVFIWADKLHLSENSLLQKLHLNDFSPLWVLIWEDKICFKENDLLQKLHLNSFSPVWVFMFYIFEKMPWYKNYIWMVSLQCESLYGLTNYFFEKMPCHKNSIWMIFPQCDFYYGYLIEYPSSHQSHWSIFFVEQLPLSSHKYWSPDFCSISP